jgi:hypothetical protein
MSVDPLTLRLDALSIAFEALVRRLRANGALRDDDISLMRTAGITFPHPLAANSGGGQQTNGARLNHAIEALFDRVSGADWRPVNNEDVWRAARLLVVELGQGLARTNAWTHSQEKASIRDRNGVEFWCRVVEALEEIGREPDCPTDGTSVTG